MDPSVDQASFDGVRPRAVHSVSQKNQVIP